MTVEHAPSTNGHVVRMPQAQGAERAAAPTPPKRRRGRWMLRAAVALAAIIVVRRIAQRPQV
ncbi:MAG: hypothetical protein WEC75_05585 [Dehalococcoidia bacterium]